MVHNYIKIGSKTIKNRTIPNLNLKQDFESRAEVYPNHQEDINPQQINNSNIWINNNKNLDQLIKKNSRLNSSQCQYLEWIPYDRLTNIQYLGQGGFSTVYSALWEDGEILEKVNGCNFEQLPRNGPRKVALKQLHNSQNICPQFLNELESSFYCNSNKTVHIYGITQEPKTKDYMIVMQLVEQGNLRTYIRENYNKLTWIKRIEILLDIARGLHSIHQAGLCHKNIHTGNLLYDNGSVLISDLGLLGPANKLCEYNEAIGVIQYMAPEILRGKPYTKSADVYGFAIIMSEMASGRPPFIDTPRDKHADLVYDICDGYRPRIKIEIPKCFEKLMLQCWDDDEFNRPNTRQLVDNLSEWYNEIRNNTHSEFMTADEQKHLQLKLPLYKYDVYKSQRVRTTDFGDDDGIKFSGNDYNGYGNDFPSLIARESDSSLEDEEDLEEYEYVSMQRNDLLSWLENVEDGMPNLLDCKY